MTTHHADRSDAADWAEWLDRRVLMTVQADGPAFDAALELIHALAPHQVRIALVSIGRELSAASRAQLASLRHVSLFACTADDGGEALSTLVHEWQPSCVHLGALSHGPLPLSVPVLVAPHDVSPQPLGMTQALTPESFAGDHERAHRTLSAADAIVAPSACSLAELQAQFGPLSDTHVIAAGVARLLPMTADRSRKRILACGTLWDRANNLAGLAEISAHLPWPVWLAGEHVDPAGGVFAAHGARILEPVHGDELSALAQKASIFVAPARCAFQPWPILLAAAAGCALVLADLKGLREYFDGAAIFVAPDDLYQLSIVLRELIDDERMRTKLAARARVRAAEFTAEAMALRYVRLYARLSLRARRDSGERCIAPVAPSQTDRAQHE